jgi:hypothetical protein
MVFAEYGNTEGSPNPSGSRNWTLELRLQQAHQRAPNQLILNLKEPPETRRL